MTSAARSTLLGRIPLVASIVVIGTTLSLLSYHWLRQSDEARVEADFIRRADTRNALTNEVIGKFEAHIFGLRHLFATTGTVSRATFAATAHDIVARNAAISALQWVPVVPAAERPAVEAAASRELGRPFQFTTRGPDGQFVSAPVAAEHLPVLYAESLADRDPMLGYDLALGATAGQLTSARRTGRMTVSRFNGPVPGQTEGTGRVAFICPVHRPGADGQAEFIGCVQGVFPLRSMLAESLKLQPGLSLDMLYFDAYETEPTRRLILYLSADGAVSESVFPTEAALRTGLTREKNLSVGDRQWQVLSTGPVPSGCGPNTAASPSSTCWPASPSPASPRRWSMSSGAARPSSSGRSPNAPMNSARAAGSSRTSCRPSRGWFSCAITNRR